MRRLTLLALAALCTTACDAFGSVDLGDHPAVRTVNLDEDFFVCRIQPEVLSEHGCATGNAGESCHLSESSFRLREVDGSYADGCVAGVHPAPPDDVLANFAATEPWIFEEIEQSPFLTRPTGVRSHPRTLFATDAAEADLIRQWASEQR